MATITPTRSSDIRTEVRTANDKFESAFANRDVAGIARLYTDDGMVLAPGSQSIKGTQGIENFWKGAMDAGIKQVKLETVEIEQHDETVIELGNYSLSIEEGQPIDEGKYIVIWKMRDNQWKLYKDIWNSNTAPQ